MSLSPKVWIEDIVGILRFLYMITNKKEFFHYSLMRVRKELRHLGHMGPAVAERECWRGMGGAGATELQQSLGGRPPA